VNDPRWSCPSAASHVQRAVYRPDRSDDLSDTRRRVILRGSRPPLPDDTLPLGPETRSVPLRIGPLKVTVTVRIEVLALPPRAGLVDFTLTWAATGAAANATATAGTRTAIAIRRTALTR
jgi:hypothetical protein